MDPGTLFLTECDGIWYNKDSNIAQEGIPAVLPQCVLSDIRIGEKLWTR